MFNNLVESDLHQQERVRRSWFFLGTLAAYALLLLFAGVASIYAYDARLGELTAEYDVTFVPPVEANLPEPERNSPPRAAPAANTTHQIAERSVAIARISESTNPPKEISSAPLKVRELPPGHVAITGRDIDVGMPGRKTWWRNFETRHPVRLRLAGIDHDASASVMRSGDAVSVVADLEPSADLTEQGAR